MANIVTGSRIVFSILILFVPTFSPTFYALYLMAGFSDAIDGPIARRTNTASEFGSKLDTLADFVFVFVCLGKILPLLPISVSLWHWIGMIAIIKILNVLSGFISQRQFIAEHTVMNKLTGLLLFLLPFTKTVVDFSFNVGVISAIAAFAAVQEGYIIGRYEFFRRGRREELCRRLEGKGGNIF